MAEHIGFIGLGTMGEPMATNLVNAGYKLTVWNRSTKKCERLAKYGASIARDSDYVFSSCSIILMMLANDQVIDNILHRQSERFKHLVKGKVIVNMGTTLPDYSAGLAEDIKNAAGHYLEAPVSGSRIPAQQGKLVAMIAGEKDLCTKIALLLAPMTTSVVECGAVPKAVQTKLAVNTYLIGLVTALTEAVNFATHAGINMNVFKDVLCSGPMANDVMRVKLIKLLTEDYNTQASISDVLYNNQLITKAARFMGAATPLADTSELLYKQVAMNGRGSQDMIAVLEAFNTQCNDF